MSGLALPTIFFEIPTHVLARPSHVRRDQKTVINRKLRKNFGNCWLKKYARKIDEMETINKRTPIRAVGSMLCSAWGKLEFESFGGKYNDVGLIKAVIKNVRHEATANTMLGPSSLFHNL